MKWKRSPTWLHAPTTSGSIDNIYSNSLIDEIDSVYSNEWRKKVECSFQVQPRKDIPCPAGSEPAWNNVFNHHQTQVESTSTPLQGLHQRVPNEVGRKTNWAANEVSLTTGETVSTVTAQSRLGRGEKYETRSGETEGKSDIPREKILFSV